MNTLIKTLALSLAVAMPAISFAQASNDPLTRAQVEEQLVQFGHSGYKPSKTQYPEDIQAAEARVAASEGTGYGGTAASTSQSNHHISHYTWNAEYGHH